MPRHNLLIDIKNSSETLLIYEILGGKPDNKIPPSAQNINQRVTRPSQKGSTCFYYASRMISNRIGKHPALANTTDRENERLLSLTRKNRTAFSLRSDARTSLLEYGRHLDVMSYKAIELFSNRIASELTDSEIMKTEVKQALSEFTQVRRENRNVRFESFIDRRSKKDSVDTALRNLEIIGLDYESELKKINADSLRTLIQDKANNGASPDDIKHLLATTMLQNAQLKRENFKPLPWVSPSNDEKSILQSFELLVQHLVKHGPLLVSGHYGKPYYKSKTDHYLTVGEGKSASGQPITITAQYWKAEERLPHGLEMGHSIIVVGIQAKKSAKLVYYLDPNDESPASEPSKIYAMSYKNFCEHQGVTNAIDLFNNRYTIGEIYAGPSENERPHLQMKYKG